MIYSLSRSYPIPSSRLKTIKLTEVVRFGRLNFPALMISLPNGDETSPGLKLSAVPLRSLCGALL